MNDGRGSAASACAASRVPARCRLRIISLATMASFFRRYVGVGPKWVLKRLRIHEAADQLTAASPPRWTELALDLGYSDHAHFTRAFRRWAGCSPQEFRRDRRSGAKPASAGSEWRNA